MPTQSELVYKSSDQPIPDPHPHQQYHIFIVNKLCAVTWQLLAYVGVKLIFILVTHTNRTGEHNVPGGAGSCFRMPCQFTQSGLTSPTDKRVILNFEHPPLLLPFSNPACYHCRVNKGFPWKSPQRPSFPSRVTCLTADC